MFGTPSLVTSNYDEFGEDGEIEPMIDLVIASDAPNHCGGTDNTSWRVATNGTTGTTWFWMDFDLAGMASAALTFDEIVEVYGFVRRADFSDAAHYCNLAVQRIDSNGQLIGAKSPLLVHHTSIPFDDALWTYAWRGQEFTLDDFCGDRVRVTWTVESSTLPTQAEPATLLGWLLDNIEVRGEPACPSDLNGDGSVQATDLALLLTSWGSCPACPADCPADLDRDGVVGNADKAILLGSWGACGGESLLGGGEPPVLQQYGFESVEEYIEWVESLSEQALNAHIVEVLEWILEGMP